MAPERPPRQSPDPGARSKALLRGIGYDARLEAEGFQALGRADAAAIRMAFGELVDRLQLEGLGPRRSRIVVLALHDVLQRIARKLLRCHRSTDGSLDARAELLDAFSECDSGRAAREVFRTHLHRLVCAIEPGRDGEVHPTVRRALAYIDAHYDRRISLADVAAHLNVSPSYLSRQFRKSVGSTMTEYIQRARLEHAMLLLAEGGRSISEIAYTVGYQNYRDFHRNFVKYENAAPKEMMRRLASRS